MNKAVIIGLIIVLISFNPVLVTASYPSNYELEWVLDVYEHPYQYQRGVYDCTEMSICTAYVLQEWYGWDTMVGVGQCNERGCHAWVVVRTSRNGWTAIETTTGGIGETRHQNKYYTALYWIEWYEVYEVTS